MPMKRQLYPADWETIALRIKEAASWVCQHCGMQCRKPGEPLDTHKRTMSVAHYPDHDPMNCTDGNLLALCSGCHLRLDLPHHMENARKTRQRKRVERGQTDLMEALR